MQQQLLSPPTDPDSQCDHRTAPKDRQQPPCEPSPNMACPHFSIQNPHHLACEGTSSLDVVSELAALRAAIREQNCLASNSLQRVLDEQRDANKIILSAVQRLQHDLSQLKFPMKPPSHLPLSQFSRGEDNTISRCGFGHGDAIPQSYLVATPPRPSPPPCPADPFIAPYPVTVPPSHAMANIKAELLEHCATLSPLTQPYPDKHVTPPTPRYALDASRDDDIIGCAFVGPTVYSWSPKPIAPRKPHSDSDEEEPSTTDVESPDNRTNELSKVLSLLECKTATSDDSEGSTDPTSGTGTPPIVSTSPFFTPYFHSHPVVPTPEWVVRCNIYGGEKESRDHRGDDAYEPGEGDMAGVLDDERVEMPPVKRIPTPSSPPTPYFRHRLSPIPDGRITVIGSHFGFLPVRASGGVQTAKETDDEDGMSSPITSSASSPMARARTTSDCYSPVSPPSRHTGGGDGDRHGNRPASASELIPNHEISSPAAALPPFYAPGNSGFGVHYCRDREEHGERSISPLEQIFTRSPPPSLPQSRCSSVPPHGMLVFPSSATLQPPLTPPHLYSEQQPPSRSSSVSSCDPPQTVHSGGPDRYHSPLVDDNVQMYGMGPVSSQPPIPPCPPRIYGTPTSSPSSSTSSPSLRCDDDAAVSSPPLRSGTPLKTDSLRSESLSPVLFSRRPDVPPSDTIVCVPTYGGVPLDSLSPQMMSVQRGQRSPTRASRFPVITPALTAAYAHSPAGSAAIAYGSPRPMISPTNSLGLQDDTAFPQHTLTLSQAEDSSLRMQRLENLVEMLQTKVLSLTDELSTIKGSPTTPRMPSAAVPHLHPQYSDITSPPPPTLFYTSPARSRSFLASSPRSEPQPQPLSPLSSRRSRHTSSPPSNKATISMAATPLTSAPSSRMPYPKSPEVQRSPVLSVALSPANAASEVKPSPPRRPQRTITTVPPPEVTYGGGMSFGDACSLGSGDENEGVTRQTFAPAPAPFIFPSHDEASPPPAPVTLNLEQPKRARVAITHSPRPIRPASPPNQGEVSKEPLRPGKMARPRRARDRQLGAENNNSSGNAAAKQAPAVIVPPPYYPRDGREILVIPDPPPLPPLQPPSLNQPPLMRNSTPVPSAFDVLAATQDRQPIFPRPSSPPSVPGAPLQYQGIRRSELPDPSDLPRWPTRHSRVAPRPVFSQPPVGSQSSFPTLNPAYKTPTLPLFLPPPVTFNAASQAPYQPRRSWARGTAHNGATPPISVQAPPPPGPPRPVTGYPVSSGATGMGSTIPSYIPHFPLYEASPATRPSYPYDTYAKRTYGNVPRA